MTALAARRRDRALLVVVALVAAPVLAGCSSNGSAGRPERTASPRPTAEASASERPTRPSATPGVSLAPSPAEPSPAAPSPVASDRPIAAPPVTSPQPSVAPPSPTPAASSAPSPSPVPTSASPTPAAVASAAPAVTSSGDDSNPWPWILLGAVVLAAIFLFAFLRRRGQAQRLDTWRRSTRPALDAALLSRDLLPALGRNITDLDHWQDVRTAADQSGRDLQSAAAAAPDADAGGAAQAAADGLSGLTLALESARLLQASEPAPTSGQLVAADAATQTRRVDLDAALARLEQVVGRPAPAVA